MNRPDARIPDPDGRRPTRPDPDPIRRRRAAAFDRLDAAFEEAFGSAPSHRLRSPGRVNLIGEHTDHQDGFVLPMAIDRELRLVLRPRDDGRVRLWAADLQAHHAFDASAPHLRDGWAAYAHGVAWSLARDGQRLRGFDAALAGDVPQGAGLSSSAALELAIAHAFAIAGDLPWDPVAMAVACRRAENDWVGVASGIMDQLICACGREGMALRIDCRDLSREAVTLPSGVRVVILDTGTRRGLVDSAYNERSAQVREAARALQVAMLRDVTPARLASEEHRLDATVRRRARHVVHENARVALAADAMRRDDPVALGRLMDASHDSLRDDFEVSSPALDAITQAARAHPACYGARMTGAGFAGCAVALVDDTDLDAFVDATTAHYRDATGHAPEAWPVVAAAGTGPWDAGATAASPSERSSPR
ncbi:MAG: galactokinase [Trueperaceae bacterium]